MPTPTPALELEIGTEVDAIVLRVLSGDEVAVMLDGQELLVRYAGVDAPAEDECQGAAAKALNEELVPAGQAVRLTVVAQRGERLVADVRLADGELVQAELLAAGLARVAGDEGDHLAEFGALERLAREAVLAIWDDCPILALGFHAHIVTQEVLAPVAIAFTPAGDVLVAEKDGRVRRIDASGVLQPDPVLEITEAVHSIGDRGLLSIAVDPAFAENGYLYALYTVDSEPGEPDANGDLPAYGRVARFQVDASMQSDPASETVLIGHSIADGPPVRYLSHAGGDLLFAPDGSLLASFGEGSDYRRADDGISISPEDVAFNAAVPEDERFGAFRSQTLDSLDGKILRIDPASGDGLSDNPFWTGDATDGRSKIFALGLRQPFRIALAPGDETRLLIGEVGYVTWEEIDLIGAGDNGGWPCREGAAEGTQHRDAVRWPDFCPPADGSLTDPVFSYHHFDEAIAGFTGRALIGGGVYAGSAVAPAYAGEYVFGDFTAGFLRSVPIGADGSVGDVRLLGTGMIGLSEIAIDPASGDIYLANVLDGAILRVAYEP